MLVLILDNFPRLGKGLDYKHHPLSGAKFISYLSGLNIFPLFANHIGQYGTFSVISNCTDLVPFLDFVKERAFSQSFVILEKKKSLCLL